MNKHLDEAIFGIAKAEAIMRSIEEEYLDRPRSESIPGELLFYALWDQIRNVENELEHLCEDSRVVDVIRAASEARQSTLKTEN